MRKSRPVYRHEIHEELIQELGKIKDPLTQISMFERLADALVFSACLGFQLNERVPLPDKGKREDIQWHIIEKDKDDALINLMAIAETKSLGVLEEKSDTDCIKVFEEFAHGGLNKIDYWRRNNPGSDLLTSIIIGLEEEKIIRKENIETTPIDFEDD
tara:strand:- start:1582 stop:2055 length:474 start_codon:yes stop_codon:yes gene_type:complete